ncbi:uncharacterized protein N7458_001952 [Penicillium daleae]|uniref:Csf1 N-terminal domain-containing protein n=1 Tax=Penicillium daleae TaxID=63821 RepID=A0AAD6CEF6_9EURO|nr:uncharacterized protein N7458_001952 [Penicillium daleae]KAJ5460400.1 hypothetical protein N7458_001952 [Penicillium daleae]
MASTSLTATYLVPDPSFNWNSALFFLFYFNRLFATLLSYAIRSYTWHYYRVYVDIKALQISLLGGRIFFKGIRYHGVNETIFIHGGFITWRYWKRTVERTDLSRAGHKRKVPGTSEKDQSEFITGDHADESVGEQGGVEKRIERPCRVAITAYGLEWFVYNRTPAYDSILAGFGYKDGSLGEDDESIQSPPEAQQKHQRADSSVNISSEDAVKSTADNVSDHSMSGGQNLDPRKTEIRDSELSESVSNLLELLPVKLDCRKGAIVMGNENTRSVLTTTFDSAEGTIAACKAGPLDLYRQLFSFKFDHPVIQMRPNPDFKQGQIATAKMLSAVKEEESSSKRNGGHLFSYRLQKRKILHSIREFVPYFQTSVESFHASIRQNESMPRSQAEFPDVRWVGLSRYLDEENDDDHEKWNSAEYGRFSTILDSPGLHLTYFWDIPGRVGPQPLSSTGVDPHTETNINNALPPEWGIDLKLDGGTINYGPWADRERIGLQNVFLPNFYRSSEVTEQLAPGVLRQNTVFRLRVEINEELTVRIPTREPSKDWMWKGRADAIRGASKAKKQTERRKHRPKEGEKGHIGPDIRPFGWLSLRVGPDSTVNYAMDMIASNTGFRNELSLDLRESRMSSSVNHGLLWQCPRHLVTCDLSNPLVWNSLRSWRFTVDSQDLELFLLRDHIFLLTDLISDWASGPPSDYHTFVPFIYNIDLVFSNLQLFINVNDRNIISNPSDLSDNRLIVINGKHLTSNVMIPLNKYQPEQNAVEFKVALEEGGVDYLMPPWDTLHSFLPEKSMATLESLFIDGSYNYFSATSSELIDTLVLNVDGVSPRLYLYGFLIKSFMVIRENYFGDEMHFKTLEEYQELAYADTQPSNPTGINPNRKSNDMDVLVRVTVDSPCALLPESIYDNSRCARLSAASLEVDLRFTNYYMDMQLSISPLKLDLQSTQSDGSSVTSGTQLFIDGLSAYGHRLFGLPPAEPTYVCNWDFDVGKILGECSTDFIACLASGFKSFDFSFDNEENALHPLFPPILFDVTFLRANIASIHISVLLDEIAVILDSQPLSIKINDWANSKFSKRLSFIAPSITIAGVDRQSVPLALRMADKTISPLGLIEMAVGLKLALRKRDITESRRLQQEHIKIHDQRTHRAQWLLFDWEEIAPTSSLPHADDTIFPPTMPIPSMPEPINERHRSIHTSYRGFSGTHAAASSRSFVVHSGTSSLRSSKASPKDVSRSSSKSEPKRRPEPTPRDASWSTVHLSRAKDSAFSPTAIRDANPWIIPHFSYWKLSLDRTDLPLSMSKEKAPEMDSDIGTSKKAIFLTFEDDQTMYTNLAVDLPLGVRGFCTPKFLHSLASLMDGLEPKHPTQIIDSLQKDVISDIVGYDKAMSQPKRSTSIAVRVPTIHMRLIDVSGCPDKRQVEFRDEYTIAVHNLRAEFQRRVERHKGDLLEGLKQGITGHAAADHFWISVEGSRTDTFEEKALFNCDLSDLNFWMVTEPDIRSHLQMRNFNTVTSAKSVERLAFLVRRATTMFDSAASAFQHTSAASKRRLRFLVYFLTKSAGEIADPIFLTRISNVLRIASSHLRQHDSWKIISRIRNIYENLPVHHKRELESRCQGSNLPVPPGAQSTVLASFDQWRAWDLAQVDKSYIMRKIWSRSEPKPMKSEPAMSLSCTVKTLRFSLDPGPRESDFIVENLSTVASLIPNKAIQGDKKNKKVAALQLYSSSAALRLRWEVVDLVEGLIKVMSPVTLDSSTTTPVPTRGEQELAEIQIIFGTDFGSVTLDAINLKLALVSKVLRGSIVHTSQSTKKTRNEGLALLFSAEACSSELFSQSRTLMLSRIADPYLYFSLMSDENELECKHEWKVAGSCRKLRYDMKEDPVSLAHTADRLIEDEIRYIRQLVENVKLPKAQPEQVTKPNKPIHNKINVAMFLDDYRLSFSLLPSLTYLITGEVARMSIMPTETSKIEVDFDIKKNSHIFSSGEGDRSRTLSILEIPPANGRILANISSARREVEVDMTIELIRLEASAVRSLLGVLTGPDVSHLISDLKQNVDVLQSHLGDVLSLPKSKTEPVPELVAANSVILYRSRLTVAGFEIHAVAPGLNRNKYSAEMILSLGMMQMRLQNGLDRAYTMDYPEFSVDAPQINFELRRQENSKSKPYGSISAGVKLQGTSTVRENGEVMRAYHLTSNKLDVELFAETAALVVDIAIYTQERIKTLDLSHEVERLRRLRHRNQHQERPRTPLEAPEIHLNDNDPTQAFLNAFYSLEFRDIQVAWNMSTALSDKPGRRQPEDLIFSIKQVELSNKKKNAAKLRIENMQLQMVPFRADRRKRSLNSALMPELVFNVAYYSSGKELWLAFQAAGKSLDIRATSEFIIPANMIRNSMGSASEALREGRAAWATKPSPDNTNKDSSLFGNRRLRSVLVDVDFTGATVSLQGKQSHDSQTLLTATLKGTRLPESKYGQYVQGDSATTATLRAPGVALKVQFEDNGTDNPALNAELKVDPSTNVLYPTLVPLVKQMTATVKEIMGEQQQSQPGRPRRPSTAAKLQPQKLMQETPLWRTRSELHSGTV